MRKLAFIAAAAAIAFCAAPADAASGTFRSQLDSSCHQAVDNKLVVPPGKTAQNFALHGVASGTNCTLAGGFDSEGFSIIRDDSRQSTVYRYTHRNGTVWEDVNGASMGSHSGSAATALKTLVLGPGTYFLAVGGGAGANVTLSYDMVP